MLMPQMTQDFIDTLKIDLQGETGGTPSQYMTCLREADPDHFGLAAVDMDGKLYAAGDASEPFTLQSVGKVLLLNMVFREFGLDDTYARVNADPIGGLGQFDQISLGRDGKAATPLVNTGAITTAGMLWKAFGRRSYAKVHEAYRDFTGVETTVDRDAMAEELAIGHLNRAVAYFLRHHGLIEDPIDALELYTFVCSLRTTATHLATFAATMANRGVNPVTGTKAASAHQMQHALMIMLLSGLYGGAGRAAVDNGLAAKSGISGGLMAAVPNRFGFASFSPPLDRDGTSVRGLKACERLDDELFVHVIDMETPR